jgi:glycosyltransferase 2 family protein
MLDRLMAALRRLNTRENWNRLGIALSLLIIGFALMTLVHMLRDVDPRRIYTAFKAIPPHNIVIAGLFVAGAYVTLTFYDWFALRTIGKRHIPYRIAAFAAFSAYSIGHNIGATVFTGNAIRFRIYSAYGLSIIDVAKLAFVTGLTFWLGNMVVLGLGIAVEPDAASAVNKLPAWLNQSLAFFVLFVIAAYLFWVGRAQRVVGRDDWQVTLPSARLTLVQIGIGILDLGISSLAMYMLLPTSADSDFIAILVTFIFATLLGFASHAPGGIGVFDAAMLVALPQFEKEELLASLLLFRLLYYITPFALALILVGARELWTNFVRTGEDTVKADDRSEAPKQPKPKARVAATSIKRNARKSPPA